MSARLGTKFLVQALIRRVESEGGFAMVLHSGDNIAGSFVLQTIGQGHEIRLYERVSDYSKGYVLMPIATEYWGKTDEITQYLARRLKSDPDLWIVELDIANAEQLAADMFNGD